MPWDLDNPIVVGYWENKYRKFVLHNSNQELIYNNTDNTKYAKFSSQTVTAYNSAIYDDGEYYWFFILTKNSGSLDMYGSSTIDGTYSKNLGFNTELYTGSTLYCASSNNYIIDNLRCEWKVKKSEFEITESVLPIFTSLSEFTTYTKNLYEPHADIYTVNLPNDNYTYDLRDSRIDEKSGQPNGLATLDSNGKVPESELPEIGSDNVVDGYYYNGTFYEESTHTTPITGADKIIYIDFHTNNTYRYDVTNQEYVKVGIHYSNATQSTDGLMSATDKEKLDGIDIVSVTVGVDDHSINIVRS